MAMNQFSINLFDGNNSVEKVVNFDQLRYAEAGTNITIGQDTYETTLLTFMDNIVETAIIPFDTYKKLFNVQNSYLVFDSNLIPQV